MSYNIDTWKTKKLENLQVPLKAFYEHERTDWHPSQPEILDADTMRVELECGCEQAIRGVLKDGVLCIDEFEMYGEGSGSFRNYVLDNALKQSTGELEAALVWEGGDSITKLVVKDGELTETEIEL